MNTSLAALKRLEESGKRATLARKTYAVCVEPMTANEIANLIGSPRDSISPRLAELKETGWLIECGERECRVTGETCVVWKRSTGGRERVKKKKHHKAIEELLAAECYAFAPAIAYLKSL